MAETTIEWTRGPRGELGYTFNGWIGCEKISPGCDHCYAAAQDKFRRWTPEGWGGPRRRTGEANWALPYRWNDAAAAAGERRRVFCSSLADVFDNQVAHGKTCDAWCCRAHATSVGPDIDHCPAHASRQDGMFSSLCST